jgi:hypothetical protein
LGENSDKASTENPYGQNAERINESQQREALAFTAGGSIQFFFILASFLAPVICPVLSSSEI